MKVSRWMEGNLDENSRNSSGESTRGGIYQKLAVGMSFITKSNSRPWCSYRRLARTGLIQEPQRLLTGFLPP